MFASTANPLSPISLTKPVDPALLRTTVDHAVARLTEGLAAGDESAFVEFHSRYFDRLYCFLLMVSRGNEDEAGEALQQTMLRVARYARRFDSEEVFWGWLKALARNVAREAGRKNRRYLALLERFRFFRCELRPESDSSEEDAVQALLFEILCELSDEDRGLLEGKYFSGETVKEIASRTGATEKAVESRLGRLRHEVKKRLLQRLRDL